MDADASGLMRVSKALVQDKMHAQADYRGCIGSFRHPIAKLTAWSFTTFLVLIVI